MITDSFPLTGIVMVFFFTSASFISLPDASVILIAISSSVSVRSFLFSAEITSVPEAFSAPCTLISIVVTFTSVSFVSSVCISVFFSVFFSICGAIFFSVCFSVCGAIFFSVCFSVAFAFFNCLFCFDAFSFFSVCFSVSAFFSVSFSFVTANT